METNRRYQVKLEKFQIDMIIKYVLAMTESLKNRLQNPHKTGNSLNVEININELTDIIGWLSLETNHTRSTNLSLELNNLCEYLESIEEEIKSIN